MEWDAQDFLDKLRSGKLDGVLNEALEALSPEQLEALLRLIDVNSKAKAERCESQSNSVLLAGLLKGPKALPSSGSGACYRLLLYSLAAVLIAVCV
jgi:hypothetical protein